MDALSESWPWYLARSAGIVAWALLALSVIVGLVQSTRVARGRAGPAWLRAFHANAGGVALAFTAVHVVGLLLDRTVDFDLADVLVPMVSEWRPVAVAWGVLAAYLTVAVGITAWARTRLPRGWWLRIHRAAALSYALATVHLLTAGTDASNPLLAGAAASSVVVVGGLLLTRLWLASPFATDRPATSRIAPARANNTPG